MFGPFLTLGHSSCCHPNTYLGYRGRNLQSTWCVLGGKSRVKVLSHDPQLLRLGQLLAKPRGVIPIKINEVFLKLWKKENFTLGVYYLKIKLDQLTFSIYHHHAKKKDTCSSTCIDHHQIVKIRYLSINMHVYYQRIQCLQDLNIKLDKCINERIAHMKDRLLNE